MSRGADVKDGVFEYGSVAAIKKAIHGVLNDLEGVRRVPAHQERERCLVGSEFSVSPYVAAAILRLRYIKVIVLPVN